MTPQEIKEVTCQCNRGKNPNLKDLYKCPETNHWLHETCDKPIEAIAKFRCATCGEDAINRIYYEFNLFKDYDSNGNLVTLLECKDCSD